MPLADHGFLYWGATAARICIIGARPEGALTIVMLHEGLGCVGLRGDFPDKLELPPVPASSSIRARAMADRRRCRCRFLLHETERARQRHRRRSAIARARIDEDAGTGGSRELVGEIAQRPTQPSPSCSITMVGAPSGRAPIMRYSSRIAPRSRKPWSARGTQSLHHLQLSCPRRRASSNPALSSISNIQRAVMTGSPGQAGR